MGVLYRLISAGRLHITYLICVYNALVLTKSDRIDQSEGIRDPGVPGTTFCQVCSQAFFCFLSPRFINFFARALFRAASQLTERLEEANNIEAKIIIIIISSPVIQKISIMKNYTCIAE